LRAFWTDDAGSRPRRLAAAPRVNFGQGCVHASDGGGVSLASVVARIHDIDAAFAPPQPSPTALPAGPGGGSFATALGRALGPSSAAAVAPAMPAGASPAERMVQIARGEVGQAEQPPGSNDSPRIAQYRAATAGAPGPGPWCAYFTSWVAQQAGVPLGPSGQGFGSVDQLWAWAQQSGKALPRGGQPQPGDLIVLPEHIGIVTAVLPNGQLQTVEGNYSNKVATNTRSVTEALGFVRPAA
jgi:CHAP domain-containing protein